MLGSGVAVLPAWNIPVFHRHLQVRETIAIFAPSRKWERAVEQWTELSAKHGCTLVQTAIAFASLPVAVKQIVLGMATPAEVHANISSIEAAERMPTQLWCGAASLGLLPVGLLDGLIKLCSC